MTDRHTQALRADVERALLADAPRAEFLSHTQALVHPDPRVASAYASWWVTATMCERARRIAR